MNIIEKIRSIISSFPRISEIMGTVHIEFADNDIGSWGLSSLSDVQISEDVLGNEVRQHSFILYMTFSSINDYERLANSSVLLELGIWLGEQKNTDLVTTVNEKKYPGRLLNIRTDSGMLINLPENSELTAVQYQLRINAEYTVEREI